MSTTDPVRKAHSRVGVAARFGTPEELADARRELKVVNLERAITKALATAPVPTDEQRDRLAALLAGGAGR